MPCHNSEIREDALEACVGVLHHLDLGHDVEDLPVAVQLRLNRLVVPVHVAFEAAKA